MRGLPLPDGATYQARPFCYNCYRPTVHCLCNWITPITAHCNILILQHPHERKKYHSTSRLVTRALTNARMIRGVKFEQEKLEQELLNSKPYLLYPGNDSLDCQAISLGQENTVVVIDGTWSEAGKIVFRNPFLQTLPRISFKTTLESNYQIRKQPKAGYLSTIESIAHLLKLNALAAGQVEKASSYQALFDVFDRMVDRQIRYFPRNRGKFISCS